MENVDAGAEDEDEAEALQNALTDLVLAEANVRAAAEEVQAVAETKAALEKELVELRTGAKQQAMDILLRVTLAASVISLYVRYNLEGGESVAGCLLMPVACALGQV